MDLFVYTANSLYLASYFVRDVLRLRLLTIVAGGCVVAYLSLQPEPMTALVVSNLFFLALNAGQIVYLLWVRQPAATRRRQARPLMRRMAATRRRWRTKPAPPRRREAPAPSGAGASVRPGAPIYFDRTIECGPCGVATLRRSLTSRGVEPSVRRQKSIDPPGTLGSSWS